MGSDMSTDLLRPPSDDRWYWALLLAQVLLVWLLPWFPTQDGPSHIYNAAILNDLLHGGKEWGTYYRYELRPAPNMGFNLIFVPLLAVVSPLIAEKLFLTIYLLLTGCAVPLLIDSFAPARPRTIQLLAIPVMFNFTLMMGFYSYTIAVPAFLIAFALAWRIRTSSFLAQAAFCSLAGIIIFFLHLIPFIFFLISLLSIAVADTRERRVTFGHFFRRITMMLPLLVLLALYLFRSRSATPPDFSYLLSGSRLLALLADLVTFSTLSLSPWQLLPATAGMFVVAIVTVSLARDFRSDRLQLDAGQWAVLLSAAALTGIYFLAPFRFGGGSFFNDRFPWVIILVLLPLLACVSNRSASIVRVALISAGILSVATNAVVFRQQSDEVSAFLSGLRSGCTKGDGISLYRTALPPWPKVDVLLHAPSYYGIFNGCVDLGNYETGLSYFPVRFRQDLFPLPDEMMFAYGQGRPDFSRYPAIKRVIGWDLKPAERHNLGKLFDNTFDNNKLSVWSRR